ncbi:MAG TPA: hypothetical protein VGX03_34495 [Candidatus Binatia bacterium]|jgi:hypothetical protein|nr:hypothetical protein [Candidatus Binatia bacterium]
MAKLRSIAGGKGKEKTFALIYGLRLYPVGEVARVSAGETVLRDGTSSQVPLHLLEGTREQIRAQLLASIDAFFDIYSADAVALSARADLQNSGVEEPGC